MKNNKILSNMEYAIKDIKEGFLSIHIWPMLGWLEIKQRYRRSIIGPFWLTISTGVMIGCMGPLYGRLFKTDISGYFAYFSISFILWMFISNIISDSCTIFINSAGYIQQMKMPFSIYVLKTVYKNIIIFFHNFIIIAVVLIFYPPLISWINLLFIVGVILIALNAFWVGIILGMLCARYRDIQQIVVNVIQLAFFMTPIIWRADMLGKYSYAANFNPLYHFLEIVRGPLLYGQVNALSWGVVGIITMGGYLFMFKAFSAYRSKIAYWI
ncbi:ABC transporter permease [Polynucleobacter sp. JS-Fieb-80-E5]|jgi:ABC-type polysaccharide/polyol phosphate export permease|uniref:ABC transporter permease n=1 Tax=Polynucleobacter sp. JS-Fieb-80-E5 TaxID=2081050 RepID=UPI001C0C1500|nr:ABC transporter permease [Polynucleobacter sp. JS-Fieb-80-E5]MBU3619950.1 ABC transporter permease [Polynucleobacter sp. JS-Fieb-80-E5]